MALTLQILKDLCGHVGTFSEHCEISPSPVDSSNDACWQDLALSLAGDMFGLLLERCNLLVARTETAGVLLEPTCQLEEDLCNLLAPVKVRTSS